MKPSNYPHLLRRLASMGRQNPNPAPDSDAVGRQNLLQLIQLRWIAVSGQVITIAVVQLVFDIQLPLKAMTAVVAALITLNLLSLYRACVFPRGDVSNAELLWSLLLDVAGLTALLYLSGGATNPFIFLYPLQVTLGAVLLETWSETVVVVVTIICFALLTRFYVPLALPVGGTVRLFRLHVFGMLICFVLDAALLAVFVSRINRNFRIRDARLASLRQHAAEEDHIVRMGLLASGAAHELGTPLATLSVILGDWRRMPIFRKDPDLLQEITDMQVEVQRCKTIVTGILLSAGEARGEAPAVISVRRFIDQVVNEWKSSRAVKPFQYDARIADDLPIVSDSALKQVIWNVLDNALEASPDWVRLTVLQQDGSLTLSISDRGVGFAPEMLTHLGKPYQSSKGRPGGGLGLFLVVNVVRKLGGSISAENTQTGGAIVILRLPLAALSIKESGNA